MGKLIEGVNLNTLILFSSFCYCEKRCQCCAQSFIAITVNLNFGNLWQSTFIFVLNVTVVDVLSDQVVCLGNHRSTVVQELQQTGKKRAAV